MEDIAVFLKDHGITPTPVRILVYRSIKNAVAPLSLSDLEVELESIDKSTISRTLNLFRERHLLHSFNDGSGSVKYEVCLSNDHTLSNDLHVHFRCEKCGETICLNSVKVPPVILPKGFTMHEVNYVVTGICAACS